MWGFLRVSCFEKEYVSEKASLSAGMGWVGSREEMP